MKDPFIIVTLDGGAASGKSSTARFLAQNYALLHIDTGLHYRALTKYLMGKGIAPEALDSKASNGVRMVEVLETIRFSSLVKGNCAYLLLNGELFEEPSLKTPEINSHVSLYAAVPELREALRVYQRSLVDLGKEKGFKGIVMEGRDIGSVVIPEAHYKFFLYADVSLREKRRQAEGICDNIQARDAVDSQRHAAPLMCPPDAVRIDTSLKDLAAVVEEVSSYFQ